jgi:hypothetical protein
MRSARFCVVASLVALILPGLMIGTAHADDASSATCLISTPSHFSPGLTLVPASGAESSGGERGSIACTGGFDGHRVTGAGTFGYQGRYTDATCLLDGAPFSGTYSFTVPTDAGRLHFTGTITDSRLFLLDFFQLTQPGAVFSGVSAIVPTNGNCFLNPVKDIFFTVLGSFGPASSASIETSGRPAA